MSSAEHGMHLYGHSQEGDNSQQERVLLDEGRGLYEGGRYRDALERFEAALALGPERENTHLWRGRALFRLEVFEEAAQAYLNALRKASRPSPWVYREVASAFLAIAGERYRRARYAETLEACEQAIGYSSQGDGRWENEGEAWRYRGHALFYLKRQTEALKAYAKAVERGSADQQLHCNMGEIFLADCQNAAALNAYQEALVLDSSSLPALKGKAQALFLLGAYVESLKAYQLVQPFEQNDPTVPLSIGDLHLLLGHQVEAHQAYEAALHAVGEDIALLSRLITVAWQDYRPFAIKFELLFRFIVRMPSGAAQNAAFDRLGAVYGAYCTGAPLPLETLKEARDKLYGLLEHFSVKRWPDILSLMAQGDERRLAQLLILLAPLSPAGLTELAHRVTLHWEPSLPDDDLGIRLYHVLETYGVPFDDADWLFAGELMARGLYIQVKSILVDLVRQRPSPDRLWFLARAMEGRGDPAREQIEVLRQFLASADPADSRCGEAWKRIAEQTLAIGEDGMAAVEALKQAERYGVATPVLRAFRAGDWEAIPALRHHPDHAFPTVVVIDLENDYEPDAEPGSRVFEIGAVRVKGGTELDACNLVIRREFPSRKVAQRQAEVVDPQEAIRLLREFTGTAILAGHNIQAFDALHLRGMGMALGDDRLVDTLIFARLLFPDSIHHSLGLLCQALHVPCEGEAHTALPDARACAGLLHALGKELVRRGERLIAGFRAIVPPGSAFDRAVLQPRRIPASSGCGWELDPAPIPPHVLYQLRDTPASPALLKAMRAETDRLIERFDPDAAFVQHLPAAQKTLVAAGGRARLERMLARLGERADIYVVPNPQTLLCPHRLRKRIEQVGDPWVQLSLFCLYQASHNRDAGTLYPLRLPPQDASLEQLGQMLLRSCCACEPEHAVTCDALCEANRAMEQSRVLLATHENLLKQRGVPRADCLIIDDAEKLQMHFAEYAAERITSEPVRAKSVEAFQLLHTRIISLLEPYMEGRTGLRARLSLQLVLSLMRSRGESEKTLLAALRAIGPVGEELADRLAAFCERAQREEVPSTEARAYWLDLWFAERPSEKERVIDGWSFGGLNLDLQQAFRDWCWKPYGRRIICGSAISLGALGTTFFRAFFGLPEDIPFEADERPLSRIYIPPSGELRPASFLARRSWMLDVGRFLYKLAVSKHPSLVVALPASPVADALISAFAEHERGTGRQVLALSSGWSTAKIAERLANPARLSMALIPPSQRESALDGQVDIEASGPIRFLDQRDPLVAALMRVFAERHRDERHESPVSTYLVPQALLELKARLSSRARFHIILDSSLWAKIYRDEVLSLFRPGELCESLPALLVDTSPVAPDAFLATLAAELERRGCTPGMQVSDEELHATLQAVWELDTFRTAPLKQKEVVRRVLAGEDQLVVAATGGGKSLCYQLPAVLMAQDVVPRITLVFSPLIALMQDQVEALRRKGIFSAVALNSALSPLEQEHFLRGIARGDYSIVYLAPEKLRSSALLRALQGREIGLVAFDEAHCISQWGHRFRTDYFVVSKWIERRLCAGHRRAFPMLALTATARRGYRGPEGGAGERSTVRDILEQLGLKRPGGQQPLTEDDVVMTSPERPELVFRVEHITRDCEHCRQPLHFPGKFIKDSMPLRCSRCNTIQLVKREEIREKKLAVLIELLEGSGEKGLRQRWDTSRPGRQRGLIYCAYQKTTEWIAHELRRHSSLHGLRVAAYHAGVPTGERRSIYERFTCDEEDGLDMVVATNAFGMGIDVRDLGFVIHFDVPATPEAYYQEAGRAGRDRRFKEGKERAPCILLYHESDLEAQRWLQQRDRITEQDILAVYEALCRLRKPGEMELFATEKGLSLLSGVKCGQIGAILYYLEHHGRIEHKPVLERAENATGIWLLKFEQGYQQCLAEPSLIDTSRQLAHVFATRGKFTLSVEKMAAIQADELATHLGWSEQQVRREKRNLTKRHILADAAHIYIRWLQCRASAQQVIERLVGKTLAVLEDAQERRALLQGKEIAIHANPLLAEEGTQDSFAPFLAFLASAEAGQFRLFERLKPSSGPGNFTLRMHLSAEADQYSAIHSRLSALGQQLCQILQRYAPESPPEKKGGKWGYVDLLEAAPDYGERQLFKQLLHLLKELALLEITEQERDQEALAMRIIFHQEVSATAALKVDLASLRLVERYAEKKLELMHMYATAPEEERSRLLCAYFFGEMPLVEPFRMRTDLTAEQREIVALTEGCHLVEGPAGSGKTTVLLEHIRYLVECTLVPIDRILVATHFSSAVQRIGSILEPLEKDAKHLRTLTLHALGESIFKRYRSQLKRWDSALLYSDGREPELANQWRERDVLRRVLDGRGRKTDAPNPGCWPADLPSPQIVKSKGRVEWYEKAIRLLREHGIFPLTDTGGDGVRTALKSVSERDEDIAHAYAVYLDHLRLMGEEGLYTFDDQILFALVLLRTHQEMLLHVQRSYEHIIIDEFQDLTPAQADLLSLLASKHQNILAFGDHQQSIRPLETRMFSLSPAFDRMHDGDTGHYHMLTKNFRSVQEILNLAHAVFQDGRETTRPQESWYGESGVLPTLIRVSSPSSSSSMGEELDEALLCVMVDVVLRQVASLPPRDRGSVALMLARSSQTLGASKVTWLDRAHEYLTELRYPFVTLSRKYCFQSYNGQLVLAYFRLLLDPNQFDLLERLIRALLPGLEWWQTQMLKEQALLHGNSLLDVLTQQLLLEAAGITAKQQKMLQPHLRVLSQFTPESHFSSVWGALAALPDSLITLAGEQQDREELEKMRKELWYMDVEGAIEYVDRHIAFLDERHVTSASVVLTTIDHAKSQAFDTVFLLGAHHLKSKERWYVAISRARRRFFFLVDAQKNGGHPIISKFSRDLYDELVGP